MIAGFLVPPTLGSRATSSAGCTHQSVTPTTSGPRPRANSASVTLGTRLTMRWGGGDHRWVRPVHWLLALHGTTATLVVNGTDVLSHTFAPRVVDGFSYGLNNGMVGVGAYDSIAYLDNVAVQVLPPEITFENTEDFTDGVADLFAGQRTGTWQIAGNRYLGAPVAPEDRAVSIFDPGIALGMAAGEAQQLGREATSEPGQA